MSRRWLGLVTLASLVACGGGNAPPGTDAGEGDAAADANVDAFVPTCTLTPSIPTGSTTGHADPLHATATEARAGRIQPADLPAFDSGLQVWDRDPAFVLANDRIAIVIEDVGPSDLYDPWGGRILGMARVEGGRLVDPGDFGEFFVLTGRSTVVTRSVTVMNDGSDGQPAVIRAEGMLAPLPFFEAITHGIFPDGYTDIDAAIDYTLAPGSDHVDISMTYSNPRAADARVPLILHGFLYTDRMRPFIADHGFDQAGTSTISWLGFADERHTSFVYEIPDQMMNTVINESGFLGRLTPTRRITACGTSTFAHARLTLGSPGADGALLARANERGDAMRAISGVVREPDGAPAVGVRVHAVDAMGHWITRSNITGADGSYTLHVPAALDVMLDPYRAGNGAATQVPASASTTSVDLAMPASGFVHVTATDAMGEPLPVRVSVLPTAGDPYVPPGSYGEESIPTGRVGVDYAITGDATIRVPMGSYRVVASRGYEYELGEAMLTVGAHGQTASATLALERSVDTTGVQCGDFHIHTRRSADSGDDATMKVRSALADGLEIPVRSDHEYVGDFQSIIASLGMTHFAHGICSIEMTSMELWGHMGVFPLVEDPSAINAGAPAWQTYPTPSSMGTPFRTMGPHEVFQIVRARPEAPAIIINHPRGNTNYFGYVGYDDVTGMVGRTQDWDVDFTLVEVFNDNNWRATRDGTVADWLSLLDHGRPVFAVGSSDSHGISGSPVGYPRTCIDLGTDDPAMVVPNTVRDRLAAGHATVSGGIYVTTSVGSARSGDTVHVGGSTAMVHVHVEAATWVDVDALDVVVDGQTTQTIMILPGDADPTNPVVRFDQDLMIDVRATGSYVIAAAYGDSPLEPVHRGRIPFGVTNPIFLMP
jgi:hypothetical protein